MKTTFCKMPRQAFGHHQLVGKSFKFADMRTSSVLSQTVNGEVPKIMSHLKHVSVGVSYNSCMYSPDGGGGGRCSGADRYIFVVVNHTTNNYYSSEVRKTYRDKKHAEEVRYEDVTDEKKEQGVNVGGTPNAHPKKPYVICEFIVPGQAAKHQSHIDDVIYHTQLGYRFKTWKASRFVEYLIGEEKKGILDFHGLIHKDIYKKLTEYYGYPKYNVKTFCRHCSFKNWHGERKMK